MRRPRRRKLLERPQHKLTLGGRKSPRRKMRVRALARLLDLPLWRLIRAISPSTTVDGCRVMSTLGLPSSHAFYVQRVAHALECLREFDPASFARLTVLVRGIWVYEDVSARAKWWEYRRWIGLNAAVVDRSSYERGHLAALLVHELTHARLGARGISVHDSNRQRVEAICIRREAAFVRRMPGGEAFAGSREVRAAQVLADPPEDWSAAEMRRKQDRALARYLEPLEAEGAPRWVARGARWFLRRAT